MATAGIGSAVAKLQADTKIIRSQGLEDLKRILGQGHSASKLNAIGDDEFHMIFELLYKIVVKEKQLLLRASKPTSVNNATSRLSTAAAALRLAVEIGAPRIRFRTALSVLDHIVQILPNDEEGTLCEPLKNDYLQSFRLLLDHSSHAEHLRPKKWRECVNFILTVMHAAAADVLERTGIPSSRDTSMTSRSGQPLSIRISQRTNRSNNQESINHVDDAVWALKSLTAVTNAPILTLHKDIATCLVQYLELVPRAHEGVFETLNNIMIYSLSEDVMFVRDLLVNLVPIIRQLWSAASTNLRERMALLLYICRELFLTTNEVWKVVEVDTMEPLLSLLFSDYSNRQTRDMLQLDDLQLITGQQGTALQTKHFTPIRDSPRAVSTWLTLVVIAVLVQAMDSRANRDDNDVNTATPRKRPRMQTQVERMLDHALDANTPKRLAALQVLMFIFDQPEGLPNDIGVVISSLSSNFNYEDSNIQSWNYLVLARLVMEDCSTTHQTSDVFSQLCSSVRRAMLSTATCRAACHLLTIMSCARQSKYFINPAVTHSILFDGGANGPCILTDTSLVLFTTTLRWQSSESDRIFEDSSFKILGWLAARWTIPSVLDRLHNHQLASHGRSDLLIQLFMAMCGQSKLPASFEDWSPPNSLWRASLAASRDQAFRQYIFGLLPIGRHEQNFGVGDNFRSISTVLSARLKRRVSELFTSKLSEFTEAWQKIKSERNSNISLDMVAVLSVVCAVTAIIWAIIPDTIADSKPQQCWLDCWKPVYLFLSNRTNDNLLDETLRPLKLRCCTSILQALRCLTGHDDHSYNAECLSLIEDALQLSRGCSILQQTTDPFDEDFQDSFRSSVSQNSQYGQNLGDSAIVRQDLPFCPDESGLMTWCRIKLITVLQVIHSNAVLGPADAKIVVDEILSLDPRQMLSARGSVIEFLGLKPGITREDAARFLQRLAEACLQEEYFERCESALCFCVTAMRSLAGLWIADENEEDNLAEVAFDIYSWYIGTALDKSIASPTVLMSLADLLGDVLRLNSTYGSDDIPSPRTSLLKILRVSGAGAKHHLANILAQIFEKYVLTQHEAIFDDIIENLPADPDKKEGIAGRLYVVARLGASWHTVLRQAVYHLFETAGNVPSTSSMARNCIIETCTHLQLKSPRELFRLFAPQLFYTWLLKGTISRMPFQAFEYGSIEDLVLDNVSELVGQIALRGHNHADELAKLLGMSWVELLHGSFARADAYTLASEMSLAKADRLYDGSAKLLRRTIGSEAYAQLIQSSLPDVVAILITSLQDDRGIDKAFEKASMFAELKAWQDMSDQSGAQVQLPYSQQPSFRARFLPEELIYLSSRLSLNPSDIWSSALLVHVCRTLLERANTAMGPLQSCIIIRKIRIVICFAGQVALQGYPLEMLLHNLQPFLTNFECAADAVSIFKYLLNRGRTHLSCRLSFIAGLSVSIFASLSGFISSPQDSTTQDSHFVSTITKAVEFKRFLSKYLDALKDSAEDEVISAKFAAIMECAKGITQAGSSSRSTNEGNLLYALLNDRSSEKPLLHRDHSNIAVEILCKAFKPATDPLDDILSNDEDVARSYQALLFALGNLTFDDAFRVWAAQAIGRGYVVRGFIDTKQEQSAGGSAAMLLHVPATATSSYSGILEHLVGLLWGSDTSSSAYAEKTLQSIATALDRDEEDTIFSPQIDRKLMSDLKFTTFPCPPVSSSVGVTAQKRQHSLSASGLPGTSSWAAKLLLQLCSEMSNDPVLPVLIPLIVAVPCVADSILEFVVHIVLLSELNGHQAYRNKLSTMFSEAIRDPSEDKGTLRFILNTILYLRRCQIPGESNEAKRNSWLEIDFHDAASAAAVCRMWTESLLFLELQQAHIHLQGGRNSRRSFNSSEPPSRRMTSKIYENLDDPDFFYGKQEESDLNSVIEKLTHEGASFKAVSFQSARLDSLKRTREQGDLLDRAARDVSTALSAANMQGLAEAVIQSYSIEVQEQSYDRSGRELGKLDDWDVIPPADRTQSPDLAKLLHALSNVSSKVSFMADVDKSLLGILQQLTASSERRKRQSSLSQLAVLAEIKQTLSVQSEQHFTEIWKMMGLRQKAIKDAEFDKILPLLIGRETLFGAIRHNEYLQSSLSSNAKRSLLLEVQVVRQSLAIAADHEVPQFCLNRAMYLSDMIQPASEMGLQLDVALQYDLATTLWTQGEASGSIRILRSLGSRSDFNAQSIRVPLSEILTELGHKVAQARLEKPDEIIKQYLEPAFKHLHGNYIGGEAGRVFHNFAAFCDAQLQDADNLDEFTRVCQIRDRKAREVSDLQEMCKGADSRQLAQLKSYLRKAEEWFGLDEAEWKRVQKNRNELILGCLKHYLLSMQACDEYPNDPLRLVTLWLNQAESLQANSVIKKYIKNVPSIRFAPLVNQLTSRLLDNKDDFQPILMELMFQICSDHPHHSLYHIFSTSKTKGDKKDEVAASRHAAANRLADRIHNSNSAATPVWISVHNSGIALYRLAQERLSEKDSKTGAKVPLRKFNAGQKLELTMAQLSCPIPPPTMKIALRPDCNYSSVPVFRKFDSDISIAGGVSAPKITTMFDSAGDKHKMLLKGGNDDLRQDAIMEQVFEQVSNLLKDHRATRQRNLGIRTYKVVPLTQNAGIIEFVQNTTPLHDFLLPAHTRYFPKDYKPSRCRKEIADAQTKSHQQRVAAYRTVCNNFHPVMRFFFLEKFHDPYQWFQCRLNYSRSSAAISILGHALGVGDRHGHNILLDTNTGEAVHIDLGVAFEAGRVLPVPEVVPFRLTRDLVDGMGMTGVEGVFRRCCEFTLEALRREQEAIMTILDVLRYDPLYSWSVSPLRLARMQENNEQAAAAEAAATTPAGTPAPSTGERSATRGVVAGRRDAALAEPSEADRALSVVAKKLGKSLSVEATVNELIRQATDENNLAVLYCGWAAYA